MKQLILVGNQKVKFQDTETTISLTLVADGNTVTIDKSKTYSVKIKNGTGYIKAITATPDTTNNMVTFSTAGFDGLPVDAYFIELWVIDTNGQTIYPSDSFIEVDITANATGIQGQVVPAITLQEFEDRFNTLQTDLEAKVETLVGPTGPTGNGISTVVTQYQLSSSGSTVPTGTWSDSPVNPTDALPYLWTRNVTNYTDKSVSTSYNISAKGTQGNNFTIQGSTSSIAGLPSTGTDGEGYMVGTELYVWTNGKWNDIVNMQGGKGDQGIQGIQGIKGDTGTGVQSTVTEYELSSQGTEIPSTGWSSTILAMTNDLPYLWTRVTITFTDGNKNMVYFTSNKGDKGDTGAKGDKGDTGANLSVKGAVDKDTDLPSSGNSEGDAYLVGTDLYVYTGGAWKNCGPIVAENTVLYNKDGSINVNGTNYNYVQDLRNGKIQYNDGTNNIELTPVDSQKEAEDILAARSYTDTSISTLSSTIDSKLSDGLALKVNIADMRKSASTVVGTDEVSQAILRSPIAEGTDLDTIKEPGIYPFSGVSLINYVDNSQHWGYLEVVQESNIIFQFSYDDALLQVGIRKCEGATPKWTGWETGAVNSNVVHISDMRKPANQVASIDEVTDAIKNIPQPDLSNYATQQQLATKADTDSIGLVNLIYNAQYSNSGDGWKLYPGAYYSDSDISSYNGSLGLGFSKAGNTVSAPVAMSKPMPLVGDGAVIPTDVYSARVKAKIYSDSSSDTKFFLTIAFLDSTSTRIGYKETFVTPDTSEDWQDVKVLGAGVPTGTSNIQIQFYTQGTLAHGMFVNPMLVKGPVVGPYQPDTIGMADVTGFATKSDVTTAVSTATANMADTTKLSNFTAGLQSNGTAVATQTDITTAVSTLKSETVSNIKGDTSFETIDGHKRFVYPPQDSNGYQFMTSEDVNSAISKFSYWKLESSESDAQTASSSDNSFHYTEE